jgi:hypothetical protein
MLRRLRSSIRALCLAAVVLVAGPAAAQPIDAGVPAPTEDAGPEPGPRELAPPTRWSLGVGLSGSIYTIYFDAADDQHGNRGRVYAAPTVWLTRVIDDDAPRSLQPFLQRTGSVYGSVVGGGFVTRYGAQSRTNSYFSTDLGVDAYGTPHFALTGGGGYTYSVLDDDFVNESHAFSGRAGLGVRAGDARFDASYAFRARATDGTFEDLRWGTVSLRAYVVFARRLALDISGEVFEGGGGGGFDVAYYPLKDYGFDVGAHASSFAYVGSDTRANEYTGSAGLSAWANPRLRFSWGYDLTLIHTPLQPPTALEADEVEHELSFNVILRFP